MGGCVSSRIMPQEINSINIDNFEKNYILTSWSKIIYNTPVIYYDINDKKRCSPFIDYFYKLVHQNNKLKNIIYNVDTKHYIIQQIINIILIDINEKIKLKKIVRQLILHYIGKSEFIILCHSFLLTIKMIDKMSITHFNIWAKSICYILKNILDIYETI